MARPPLHLLLLWVLLLAALPIRLLAETSFTYQGRLLNLGQPANGSYDLRFAIVDASTNGNYVSSAITNAPLQISNGLFYAALSFSGSVFDGSARWLEIGVRTNGDAGPYVLLTPRQPITATPYAITAGNLTGVVPATGLAGTYLAPVSFSNPANAFLGAFGGSGAGLTNLNAAGLSTGVIADDRLSSNVPLKNGQNNFTGTNYFGTNVGISGTATINPGTANKIVLATNVNGGGVGGSIAMAGTSGDNMIFWQAPYRGPDAVGGLWMDTNHIGSPLNLEMHIDSLGDMSLNFAYGGKGGRCQAGPSGYPGSVFTFQYSEPTTCSEFSEWVATDVVGGNLGSPGCRAEGVGVNQVELAFYNPRPTFTPGLHAFNNDGVLQYRVLTNGMNIRGQVIGERKVSSSGASSIALDFSKAQLQDISVSGATLTLSTTGASAGNTNRHRTTFYLRGAAATTLKYPSGATGWNTNGQALPASVAAGALVRLELEATGLGETNVQVISAQSLCDNRFTWDGDALSFFTPGRANLTDPIQKAAVNTLVLNAKAHGWWTNCDAIYPFVGGNATAHSKNLKADVYNITWQAGGGLTHNADGVLGDGTGYGDTGFDPATASSPAYSQNSAHLFFYCGTGAPTSGKYFMGGQSAGAFMGISIGSSVAGSRGPNNGDFTGPVTPTAGNAQGSIILQRNGPSGPNNLFVRGNAGGNGTTASAGVPNTSFYILDYNNGGPGSQIDASLRGATIGSKIGDGSQSYIDNYFRADWEAFETTMGRNASP